MSRYSKVDLADIRLLSITDRTSKVAEGEWASPFEPGAEFACFVDSLPPILAARDLVRLADSIVAARRRGRPVIMMIGGHVVKVGLAPVICDLLDRGLISGVAMNSAAAIHDVESTLFGVTSEDVAEALADGSFGMARETGEFINGALSAAFRGNDPEIGFGEAVGESILAEASGRASILATCVRLNRPVTVHVAIGADIIHQQPSMDGAATGELSFRDFRLLAHQLQSIGDGGVVMNVGSTVILPEVFLKALTIARNLGATATDFTTANFDMIRHYRPRVNVLERPTQSGGESFDFAGHHEIMIPLLAAMVKRTGRGEEASV